MTITPFPIPPPIPQGNPMRVTVTFKDGDGVVFDPASGIQILGVDPSGVESTYDFPADIIRMSTGVYYVEIEATIGGDWIFKGTGLLPDGKAVSTPDILQQVSKSQIP